LRIGIVTHAYLPHFGGVSENVAAVSRVLRNWGHQVTVITAGARGASAEPDLIRIGGQVMVPWNGASVNFTYGNGLSDRLAAIYRQRRFDLVHIHCPLAPMLPIAGLRAARGRPVVGMFHATAESNLGYRLFRRMLSREFKHITVPTAVSEPARRFVTQYFPASYRLVPNGVDVERFSPRVPPGIRTDGKPVVLIMGRLDPRKGVEHAIDAWPQVIAALGPVTLIVAGDGPRARSLRRRAERLAPGHVRFLGPVPASQVPGLYAAADCLCAPAVRNESFGIVIAEAMASGRAVVASDISGYRLLVAPGQTGFLAPPGDKSALADALITVLADRRLAASLGAAGRERALPMSWERVSARLLNVYREALGEAREETPEPAGYDATSEPATPTTATSEPAASESAAILSR
jgi:phosphatidylinositol alpha-mannosyltransferase